MLRLSATLTVRCRCAGGTPSCRSGLKDRAVIGEVRRGWSTTLAPQCGAPMCCAGLVATSKFDRWGRAAQRCRTRSREYSGAARCRVKVSSKLSCALLITGSLEMLSEYVALSGALVCLALFVWARSRFFKRTGNSPPLRFGLRPLGTIFGVGAIATLLLDVSARIHGNPSVAISLFFCSMCLFLTTAKSFSGAPPAIAFTPSPPDRLVLRGPYRYIRHPFYTSYMLFWTGVFVASPSLFTGIALFVMFALYVKAARFEETLIAHSSLGKEYLDYRVRTGMFLPRFRLITSLR